MHDFNCADFRRTHSNLINILGLSFMWFYPIHIKNTVKKIAFTSLSKFGAFAAPIFTKLAFTQRCCVMFLYVDFMPKSAKKY